jgi:hypothetical protein
MTFASPALTRLADYREELLHEQSPAETRRLRRQGERLRALLGASGLSRQQFADRHGLDLELIVAVENGFGCPATARRLLRLAHAWLDTL